MNNLCRLTLSQCSLTSKRMISSQIRSHSHFHIPKRTFIRIGGLSHHYQRCQNPHIDHFKLISQWMQHGRNCPFHYPLSPAKLIMCRSNTTRVRVSMNCFWLLMDRPWTTIQNYKCSKLCVFAFISRNFWNVGNGSNYWRKTFSSNEKIWYTIR